MEAKVLVKADSILGEGAWYDWEEDVLVWLDIWGQKINIYDPKTNTNKVFEAPRPITTIVPSANGYILGSDQGVWKVDKEFKNFKEYVVNPDYDYSIYRCNDGKCGPDGKFWIGIMERTGKAGMGTLYSVDNSGATLLLDKLDVPNGIVWDEKRNKMYFTDTLNATVFAYDYKDGRVSNPEPVFHAETGMTDGMTIDEDGNLWIAVWGSCKVYYVDPVAKKVIDTIDVDAPQVSSTAIHNGKIYITSANSDMSAEDLAKYPNSGSLFVADVPVKGIEAYRYKY